MADTLLARTNQGDLRSAAESRYGSAEARQIILPEERRELEGLSATLNGLLTKSVKSGADGEGSLRGEDFADRREMFQKRLDGAIGVVERIIRSGGIWAKDTYEALDAFREVVRSGGQFRRPDSNEDGVPTRFERNWETMRNAGTKLESFLLEYQGRNVQAVGAGELSRLMNVPLSRARVDELRREYRDNPPITGK